MATTIRRSARKRTQVSYSEVREDNTKTTQRTRRVNWGNKLCECEVIDRKPGFIRLHYPGWSRTYDEWVPAGEDDPTPIVKCVRRGVVTSGYDEWWEVLFSDVGTELTKALTCHRLFFYLRNNENNK